MRAEDIWVRHRRTHPWVLTAATLTLAPGTITGLSGPSGSGKSTLGATLAGMITPDRGEVIVDGKLIDAYRGAKPVQLVLQRPELSMDPRWRIRQILAEAGERPADGEDDLVSPRWLDRYPHEISGGELQRVNLARALRATPAYLIADEISSSLDALTQALLWDRILEAAANGLGVLAISHDPDLLSAVADEQVRIEDGRLVTQPQSTPA